MAAPQDVYSVEPSTGYSEGFCPIRLGQYLGPSERFRVLHKLGHGGYSTVWLCEERDAKDSRWKAVKVLCGEESTQGISDELKAFNHFKSMGVEPTEALENGVVIPLEHFWHTRDLGGLKVRHLCFVLPLLGKDVGHLTNWNGEEERMLLKSVCLQMTKAVDFIHSKGLCHGDLRPANVLFRVKGLDQVSVAEMYELLGEPERFHTSIKEVSYPEELIAPAYLANLPKEYMSSEIAITDFGIAFQPSDPPKESFSLLEYHAPEWALGGTIGFKTDVWALGCLIAELHNEISPYSSENVFSLLTDIELLSGPMPHQYRLKLQTLLDEEEEYEEEECEDADDAEYLKGVVMDPEKPAFCRPSHAKEMAERSVDLAGVEDRLLASLLQDHSRYVLVEPGEEVDACEFNPEFKEAHVRLPREEAYQLRDLLEKVFRWMPEERPSAEGMQNHPWFTSRQASEEDPQESVAGDADELDLLDEDPFDTIVVRQPPSRPDWLESIFTFMHRFCLRPSKR